MRDGGISIWTTSSSRGAISHSGLAIKISSTVFQSPTLSPSPLPTEIGVMLLTLLWFSDVIQLLFRCMALSSLAFLAVVTCIISTVSIVLNDHFSNIRLYDCLMCTWNLSNNNAPESLRFQTSQSLLPPEQVFERSMFRIQIYWF